VSSVTTLVIGGSADLAGVKDAASRASTPLLWLLAADAVPNDRTLPALGDDEGAAMVSVPLWHDEQPAETLIGSFADDDLEGLLAAAQGRRIPLRFTPVYSLLVPRELVLSHDAPDPTRFGPYAGIEWTARLFSRRAGMLVPASTVTVPARRLPVAPRALLRLGPKSGLRHSDRLRQIRVSQTARGDDG
jgi:hypothetical protein